MKEVKKAAKKAKAFETQKIVKKLKALGLVYRFMDPSSGVISWQRVFREGRYRKVSIRNRT